MGSQCTHHVETDVYYQCPASSVLIGWLPLYWLVNILNITSGLILSKEFSTILMKILIFSSSYSITSMFVLHLPATILICCLCFCLPLTLKFIEAKSVCILYIFVYLIPSPNSVMHCYHLISSYWINTWKKVWFLL